MKRRHSCVIHHDVTKGMGGGRQHGRRDGSRALAARPTKKPEHEGQLHPRAESPSAFAADGVPAMNRVIPARRRSAEDNEGSEGRLEPTLRRDRPVATPMLGANAGLSAWGPSVPYAGALTSGFRLELTGGCLLA